MRIHVLHVLPFLILLLLPLATVVVMERLMNNVPEWSHEIAMTAEHVQWAKTERCVILALCSALYFKPRSFWKWINDMPEWSHETLRTAGTCSMYWNWDVSEMLISQLRKHITSMLWGLVKIKCLHKWLCWPDLYARRAAPGGAVRNYTGLEPGEPG